MHFFKIFIRYEKIRLIPEQLFIVARHIALIKRYIINNDIFGA